MTKKEENAENICHWNECLTQYSTAEDLFNHVCATHIGRKSAGTLSLECKWTGCQARASKRDHLTSHCRVHIALKPHVCSVCTKAFKRPQDLKKHEKIHTEEHHANHRQAKAIIVPSKGSNPTTKQSRSPQPPTFGTDMSHQDTKSQIPAQQPTPYPFAFPTLGYPHHFVPQFQPAVPQPGGGGMPPQSVDQLAQFIALQQQLNSQAQAAASQGFSLPGMTGVLPPGYPIQLSQNPYGVAAASGISFMPQGVYHYGFSAPGQHQPQYVQISAQPQQAPGVSQHRNSTVSSVPSTSITSNPSQSSLYPSLASSLFPSAASAPAIKAEDQPSPAQSYKSQYSSMSSPSGVPALSPPSLSTPENSFSPTPELDSDSVSGRRSYGQVAGKKRGFDEAAEHFLGDLKNKRFQSQDTVNDQLDVLSSFLLSPEVTGPPALTPGRTTDDSSSSNGSDYGRQDSSFDREEVDTINQLLLSLGQNIDNDPHALQHPTNLEAEPYMFSHHPEQAHAFNSLAPVQQHNASTSTSLYPVLPGLAKGAISQQYSYSPAYPTLPAGAGGVAHDPSNRHANLRLSKPPTAPTIAGDYRTTQYQHVARLQRAAPVLEQQEGMEVDEEMAEAASALLMGKSYSAPASSSAAKPTLPPIAIAPNAGPRLAPIAGSSATSPPTLPHIRDVVSLTPPRRSSFSTGVPESPSSPSTSSAAFASPPPVASTSRSMYPSLSSTPTSTSSSSSSRPVSAGGVERLTHRVHKMRLPSTSSETSNELSGLTESGSVIDTTEELSASSDEDDEDHPNSRFKKTRRMRESPISLVKEEDEIDQLERDGDEEDVKPIIDRHEHIDDRQISDEQRRTNDKRRATIAYLVGYINAKYRESLAKRSVKDLRKAILKPSTTQTVESSSQPIEA